MAGSLLGDPKKDGAELDPVSQSDSHDEIVAEQAYVDRAYARLDVMRRSAAAVAEAYSDVRRGGTHQARLERDIAVNNTLRRLAALDIRDAPLCFGRIDLETGDRAYIGRLSVDDEEHSPLVIDWRAPVAEPFYRATAIDPMRVVRRRHFQIKGRELLGLDDEVFDQQATDEAGFTVVGEAALLAALDRKRTGRMHDIVATIQAQQDEAIRAELPGVLIVTGGPGTGKTAVALHRAAYLLYTHRQRLASRGVLLVGPNPLFLRYIDEVLPSLGEDDVQLTTVAGIKAKLRVTGAESDELATIKGDARMVKVIAGALKDRERRLPRDVSFTLDRHRLRITRRDTAQIVERARARRGTHNALCRYVNQILLDKLAAQFRRALVRSYRGDAPAELPIHGALEAAEAFDDVSVAALLARGEQAPEAWEQHLRARLRRIPEVRAALERMWPVLNGAEIVHDLFSFTALIRSAADGVLTRDEQVGLHRPRSANVRDVRWTEADLALVDEADALLGPVDEARPARRKRTKGESREFANAERVVEELGLSGHTTAAQLAARFAPATNGSDNDHEPRTYGHVLIDEAQDLSAMQWRMLARRCPSASMTLVGDFGQASKPGALRNWDEVVTHLPERHPARVVELTVNYRTPAEVMALAHRLLAVVAPDVAPTEAVRATGREPAFLMVDGRDVISTATSAARRAITEGGTIAVIAPREHHDALATLLADVGAVAGTVQAIDAPIAVIDATTAKGLEFDHVVIVEPAALVPETRAGLRLLYVTLTRATQTLTVVHAGALPEALHTPPSVTEHQGRCRTAGRPPDAEQM